MPFVSVYNAFLLYFLDGFCKQSLGLYIFYYLNSDTIISLKDVKDDRFVFGTASAVSIPFATKIRLVSLNLALQYIIGSCLALQYREPHHVKRVQCRRIDDV